MSLIFCRILGPLVLGWTPNHFVLGAQLAPGEKMLVCNPVESFIYIKENLPRITDTFWRESVLAKYFMHNLEFNVAP